MLGNFISQNVLFFTPTPQAIQYLKNHHPRAMNEMRAYFKTLCLKLTFGKYDNQKCHSLLIGPHLTLNNKIIYLEIQNWCSKQWVILITGRSENSNNNNCCKHRFPWSKNHYSINDMLVQTCISHSRKSGSKHWTINYSRHFHSMHKQQCSQSEVHSNDYNDSIFHYQNNPQKATVYKFSPRTWYISKNLLLCNPVTIFTSDPQSLTKFFEIRLQVICR